MHHRTPYGTEASRAYGAIGIETGVAAADPLGLVVMLYDGAIQAIVRAETALASGDIESRGRYTSKAIDIVCQGLKASLDRRASGALVDGLADLYEYMERRLFAANLKGDVAIYREIRTLLADLRGSWAALRGPAASPVSSPATVALDLTRINGRSLVA